jgi:hypothetical protein
MNDIFKHHGTPRSRILESKLHNTQKGVAECRQGECEQHPKVEQTCQCLREGLAILEPSAQVCSLNLCSVWDCVCLRRKEFDDPESPSDAHKDLHIQAQSTVQNLIEEDGEYAQLSLFISTVYQPSSGKSCS